MGCLGGVFPSVLACLRHMSSVDTRQTDPSFTTIFSLEVLVGPDDGFILLLPRGACLLTGKMTHGVMFSLPQRGVPARQRGNLWF